MSSVRAGSNNSPVRSVFNDKLSNLMYGSKANTRTNSVTSPPSNSREGFTAQVQRMKLEADLHLESGDVQEYIKVLDELYAKVKLEQRYRKLHYEVGMQFQKYGYLDKSLSVLSVLYEETSRYDDDSISKSRKLFQFSLDISNSYFGLGKFKKAFEYYGISLKYLQGFSSCDLSIAQLYSNKGL